MNCDARIRPFPAGNDTELICEVEHDEEHTSHSSVLKDYAYPGASTRISWLENDRRNFHGEWPGKCIGCVLPLSHRGFCATE
jgi:hypothetical protein